MLLYQNVNDGFLAIFIVGQCDQAEVCALVSVIVPNKNYITSFEAGCGIRLLLLLLLLLLPLHLHHYHLHQQRE